MSFLPVADAIADRGGHLPPLDGSAADRSGVIMASIQWTPDMSVGVESLDNDHKLLLSLVNQLDDAIRAGTGEDTVSSVLDALLDYAQYHFAREEALMAACGYPDDEAHHHTHEVMRTQVTHIRDRYVANPETIHDREVLAFLKNWLTAHIMGRDKLYAPFMASKADEIAEADRAFTEKLAHEGAAAILAEKHAPLTRAS